MHAKKSSVIEATTKTCRWLMIFLLPCDFALTVALMTQPQKTSDQTFEESENLNLAAVRLATSSITAMLSLISLFLVVPRFKFSLTRRMIAVFALRVISGIMIVPELAYPTATRTTLNVIILSLIFIELIIVCVIFVKLSKVNRAFYGQKQRNTTVSFLLQEIKQSPSNFLDNLDDWIMLKDSRKMLRRKYNVAQAGWALACAAVFLIGFIIFVFEFTKIASTQKKLYSSAVLEEMNMPSRVSYFGNVTQYSNITQPRVLVVVLDGMRYDYLHVNKDMENLFTSADVAPHTKIFKMRAQLPSMSVPNWMTILTGAPPEATGVLGNLLIPETKFDSMFKEAQNFNLNRGLTGSPWFSAIIDSTLPFLDGDGTIPTSLGAHGRETSDVADNERANVARYALTQRDYSLFLAHFSDIDIQGHCCGVSEKYNEHNTYYSATTNKSVLLQDMIGWVDEDTTIIIVADHGHVDRGGHGGVDDDLTEVPLIIYKKNSFIGNKTYDGPRFAPHINNFDDNEQVYYTNMDVAPTVCAILGVPAPRQTHGIFIDDAMLLVTNDTMQRAYYDLYMQKKDFLSAYIHTAGISTKYSPPDLTPGLPLQQYVDAIEQIIVEREKMRDRTLLKEHARNIVVTTIVCLAIAACMAFILHAVSFCDPVSVFSLKHTLVRQKNRIAMGLAFLTTFGYYGLSILIYFIAFEVVGYSIWDSTVIHYPQVLTRYALLALVPAAIVVYLLVRGIHVFYTHLPRVNSFRYLTPIFNPLFFGRNPMLRDPGVIFLYRYYLSGWVVVSTLIFIILQSSYTFIIPPVFSISYITPSLWVFRFRIITVQLMSIPMIITSIIMLFFGFPSRNPNKPHFDPIYMLKISKDLRMAKHPSALENIQDDVPMEDPILQKHKNCIFYSAILHETANHRFERVNTIYDVASIPPSEKERTESVSNVLVRDHKIHEELDV